VSTGVLQMSLNTSARVVPGSRDCGSGDQRDGGLIRELTLDPDGTPSSDPRSTRSSRNLSVPGFAFCAPHVRLFESGSREVDLNSVAAAWMLDPSADGIRTRTGDTFASSHDSCRHVPQRLREARFRWSGAINAP
jgi:hypothetical protein